MPQIKRDWPNFFLGLFVALLPLLGLPSAWKTVVLVIAGLLIAFFALAPKIGQTQEIEIGQKGLFNDAPEVRK